ncbi:MAG: YqeG family HAD IIIA-type phosphatase [Lachnospiraceae bacterium]|nr:YqeG family HAD IIIA-type phosphatase [Lachnospiraceae bacterium]
MRPLLQPFYPSARVASSYDIAYEALYQTGIRGLIYDIDNTLVPHGAPADEKAVALFARLHEIGFQTCLISNNQLPRVAPFAQAVDSMFVEDAHKPSMKNYQKAMQLMGTDTDSTYFIGDQLFTDIYGANRTGIPSILVSPIHPKEEIQIVLKRYLERIVLFFYDRDQKKAQKKRKTT